jgi:hypothetical protein
MRHVASRETDVERRYSIAAVFSAYGSANSVTEAGGTGGNVRPQEQVKAVKSVNGEK